jgi:polyhydroxyalkanoate synthesis regulator phasin
MFETLDKLMLAGLGAMSMTREKAEEIFDEYVEKGKAQRTNKDSFVRDLMDRAEKSRKEMEKTIHDQVEKALVNQPIATKDDIKRLETKLDLLLAKRQ